MQIPQQQRKNKMSQEWFKENKQRWILKVYLQNLLTYDAKVPENNILFEAYFARRDYIVGLQSDFTFFQRWNKRYFPTVFYSLSLTNLIM